MRTQFEIANSVYGPFTAWPFRLTFSGEIIPLAFPDFMAGHRIDTAAIRARPSVCGRGDFPFLSFSVRSFALSGAGSLTIRARAAPRRHFVRAPLSRPRYGYVLVEYAVEARPPRGISRHRDSGVMRDALPHFVLTELGRFLSRLPKELTETVICKAFQLGVFGLSGE